MCVWVYEFITSDISAVFQTLFLLQLVYIKIFKIEGFQFLLLVQ